MSVRADVHHRLISFESEIDAETDHASAPGDHGQKHASGTDAKRASVNGETDAHKDTVDSSSGNTLTADTSNGADNNNVDYKEAVVDKKDAKWASGRGGNGSTVVIDSSLNEITSC